MSNNVGGLFKAVIDGVVKEARVDFEELGEDEATLQLLQATWQKRLSEMHVATFLPWETEPRATGVYPGARNAAGYYGYDAMGGPGAGAGSSSGLPAQAGNMPFLKEEDPFGDPASMRAAQHVHSYGAELPGVDQSVRGIMGRGLELPPGGAMPGPHASAMHPGSGNVLSAHQQQNNGTEAKTENASGGGGLHLPHLPQTDGLSASADELAAGGNKIVLSPELKTQIAKALAAGPPQVDGQSEEVNSDLDDSEDELNSDNEGDEGDQGMIMLCLYDKVQRVKNKWKYVLKDGVANINGLDYVFSRATGESEW